MSFLKSIQKYYSSAKRIVLLAQDNQTKRWYHIYSVFELLPKDITSYNIPTKSWKGNIIRAELSSKTNLYSFYLMVNNFDSIDSALSAFSDPFINNNFEGQPNFFFNSNFIKEPSSESPLVLSNNFYSTEGIASIIPKRRSGFFVWTKIDNERTTENEFKRSEISKDMKAMSQLTFDWLGFDIWSKSEHIGNIYLVAPNPYFRDLNISLSTNPYGIFYDFKLRSGIKEAFKIRLIDYHGNYTAFDKMFIVKDKCGLLEMPHEPHLIEIRVYNSNDDLITFHEPAIFIKSFQLNMSIKQADFHVTFKDKEKKKEFVVEKFSSEQRAKKEKEPGFMPEIYFTTAESKRQHIENEKNRDFIFFNGSKNELEKAKQKVAAKEIIHELINRAKNICFLCDPYFSVSDLVDYAFYIKDSGVNIRILNARGSKGISKEKAKNLQNAIEEYNKKPFQKIECRILKGESILHDRFLISDSEVWYFGSSFNEFGSRATCIAHVPKSNNEIIIKEIEKWFYNDEFSEALKDYSLSVD